jgi:RNA polymerase sigma-70 factor (ECF subfamily)
LVQRCLAQEPGAWKALVDQYLPLVYRIIYHTAHQRGVTVRPEDVEDFAADVMFHLVSNNYAALRHFQGRSSLATYLTVICRRSFIHLLAKKLGSTAVFKALPAGLDPAETVLDDQKDSLEQVHDLLTRLPKQAREVVRLYYLEGRSYEDISAQLGIPVNSIGPLLSRARKRLHAKLQSSAEQAALGQERI